MKNKNNSLIIIITIAMHTYAGRHKWINTDYICSTTIISIVVFVLTFFTDKQTFCLFSFTFLIILRKWIILFQWCLLTFGAQCIYIFLSLISYISFSSRMSLRTAYWNAWNFFNIISAFKHFSNKSRKHFLHTHLEDLVFKSHSKSTKNWKIFG